MMRIGCSGWSYSHWEGRLYPSTLPASRWLERYTEYFDTVEVNATFYRLPKRGTVARWAKITPDGFCFAVKGSRYLTHVRRLRDLPDGVARLVELLKPLSASGKLGPLLWQLPPTIPAGRRTTGYSARGAPARTSGVGVSRPKLVHRGRLFPAARA